MIGGRAPWLGDRSWLVLAVALLAVAGLTAGGVGFGLRGEQATPPWRGDPGACRQDPMAHVHHPTRLDLLARCATVAGTVRHVGLDTSYNDLKIVIAPDPTYGRYLRPDNRGVFIADVIATDLLSVPVPEAGSHITASGAWVLDRAKGTVALHPAYRIRITDGQPRPGGLPGSEPRPGQGRLALGVQAPDTIAVGERMDVAIRAHWVGEGRRRPASKIHLFAELTDAEGTGVWWQATRTNALGATTTRVLAHLVPGRYTLTVYATPSGRDATAATELRVSSERPKRTEN